MTRFSLPAVRLAGLLVLAAARPASAWEPELHVAFTRAAMGISAAAEARVPAEHRDVFFRELTEPDYVDKDCRYHCADGGAKEPAVVAEQILGQLLSPKTPMKPYQRAQLSGRFLHYALDAVAPVSLRRENAPRLVNFFSNRDLIFWREKRPALGSSLAAALRARAEEMAWPNVNADSTYGSVLRLAVNTAADALLLLPPRDATPAPDEGPVYFLVNRMDNGAAGKETYGHYEKSTTTGSRTYSAGPYTWTSTGTWTSWEWVAGSKGGGDSFKKLDMMERQGVHLVEVAARQEKDRTVLRGVLFNNSEICAEAIGFKAGSWTWNLPETMPPHSLKVFQVDAPVDILSRRLTSGSRPTACPAGTSLAGFVTTTRRVIVGIAGQTPQFEYAAQPVDITSAGRRSTVKVN